MRDWPVRHTVCTDAARACACVPPHGFLTAVFFLFCSPVCVLRSACLREIPGSTRHPLACHLMASMYFIARAELLCQRQRAMTCCARWVRDLSHCLNPFSLFFFSGFVRCVLLVWGLWRRFFKFKIL